MLDPVLLRTLTDPAIFGPHVGGESWRAWRAVLTAMLGQPPTSAEDRELVLRLTGRKVYPTAPASELWAIVGRRGGKTRVAAVLAVLLAAFRDYTPYLAAGERGTLPLIAADRKQSRTLKRYIEALFNMIPMLQSQIVDRAADRLDLANGITIEIHTASFRAVRGYTVIGAVCDEVAFWANEDSANPDTEILNALRPAMATIEGAPLICISSPFARRGELYRAYQEHYGVDGDDVLVVVADSRTMNPTLPEGVVRRAYARDPIAAASEYGQDGVVHFRRDYEVYLSREILDAAIVKTRTELPPRRGVTYTAFVDPSGGSSDSMTLAIGHREGDRVVIDSVSEQLAPFNPDIVVGRFCDVLFRYGVTRVIGDRYAGEWPASRFRAHGIDYRPADKTKSEYYLAALPMFNAGQVDLPNVPAIAVQFSQLERNTSRGGREFVDHPPRGRDDVANACAGVMCEAGKAKAACVAIIKVRRRDETLEEEVARLQDRRRREWLREQEWQQHVQAETLLRLVERHGSATVLAVKRLNDPTYELPEHLRGVPPPAELTTAQKGLVQ